jgi:hypothetical protein
MPDLPRLPSAASGAAALGSTGDDEPRCFVICLFLLTALPRPFRPSDRSIGSLGGRGATDRRFVLAWGPPIPALRPLRQSGAVDRWVAGAPWVSATVKVFDHQNMGMTRTVPSLLKNAA